MKYKYLYTNGCSHTAGGGLETWKPGVMDLYKSKYNIQWNYPKEINWPKRVSTELNLKLIDDSQSGAGLDRMVRQTWEYITKDFKRANDTIFVIEIPSIFNRLDVYDKWEHNWLITNPEWNDSHKLKDISIVKSYDDDGGREVNDLNKKTELLTEYLNTFYDCNIQEKLALQSLIGLFSYMEAKNLKFYFIPNGIVKEYLERDYQFNYRPHLLKIQNNGIEFDEFTHFASINKTRICDELVEYNESNPYTKDSHPGYFAHKEWGELTAKYIQKDLENNII